MPTADRPEQVPHGVFEALHQISVAVGGVLEPLGLARLVAEHARALLAAEAVGLWVFDTHSEALEPLHLDNAPPSWEHALPRDVADPPAGVSVPLLVGGRTIGVLAVGFPEPHQATPVAVETLTLLAAEVAPALEAARLYELARAELAERQRQDEALQIQAQLLVEARRRLEEGEQRFRSMFEHHPDAVFAWDRDGRTTLANRACERLSGYTVEEILAEPRAYAIPAEFERATALFEAALRGEPQQFETVIAHKDGHHIDVWTTQIPIVVDGQVTGVFGIARDITERRKVRDALRNSEQQFRAVWEHAADAMVLSDQCGIIQQVNPACCALYGRHTDELVGQDFTLILAETELTDPERRHRALFAAEEPPPTFRNRVRRSTGEECTVECRAEFISQDGERVGLITIMRDITERVRAEQEREQLLQALGTAQLRVQELLARVLRPEEHQARSQRRADLEARAALLSPRELAVLRQIAVGKTNPEIGDALGLSAKAARNRVADVLAKLGVPDRTRAAVLAVELGLADPGSGVA